MLFTLALLLLLTPFPSLQTTTNEKKNSTGSEQPIKPTVLTLLKPKTTAAVAKQANQSPRPTPKPSAVNQTVLTTSAPTKPPAASGPKTAKSLQTATNEKKNSTTSEQPKPTVLTLLKPKTTAAVAKQANQTPRPTPKPSAVNQTVVSTSAPTKPPAASVPKAAKDKTTPALPPPPPIKVVISEGYFLKDTQTDSGDQTRVQGQELKLRPGSPLVMTHKISLETGSCTGGCVAEMAALKGRVARLEKEVSAIKDQCPCTKVKCPNDCSGRGKCEKGKCVCLPGFLGLDCSKCGPGIDCSKKGAKDKVQITVETVTLKVTPESNAIKESTQVKKTKVDQTLFQKKTEEEKKGTAGKELDSKTKTKVITTVKAGLAKTPAKKGIIVTKTTGKVLTRVNVNGTKIGLGRPTVGQVLLKHHGGRKQEEARKGKTAVLTKKQPKPDLKVKVLAKDKAFNGTLIQKTTVKDKTVNATLTQKATVKDKTVNATLIQKTTVKEKTVNATLIQKATVKDKAFNVTATQSTVKKSNGTTKGTDTSENKTRPGKESVEQSTLAEKNVTQTSGKKLTKNVDVTVTKVTVSVNTTKIVTSKSGSGKAKVSQKSQYVVNVTTVSPEVKTPTVNKTTVQASGNITRKAGGGSGLGSVKVQDITTYGFTLTWTAPQAMFKNFTVTRREYGVEGEDEEWEEAEEATLGGDDKGAAAGNATEIQRQSESTNGTASPTKAPGSPKAKADSKHTKKVSLVLPGGVRSVEFSNLRPLARYALSIYGTAPGKRSKIHRVTVTTGPEAPTDMVFSNVTDSSITVSWSKPKCPLTGFKIIYTHSLTGESSFVFVDAQHSHAVLSKLSAGSSYVITVISTLGKGKSDGLTAQMTTVPAPPTHLQAINITDTKAVVQWTPSLGKVDRFIISYESAKMPNVTVTVMVSGNSVEHQLRGLQRATLYTVKALSQKDSLQSTAITTTFTTASVVKASEVDARSAVIAWKVPIVAFHSYRVTYLLAGEETKEVILEYSVSEYKLTGLLPMSKYTVLVEGERDGQYTSVVTTEFTTGKLRFPFPTECSQELLNGALQSGEVDVYPQGKEGGAVRVYCDMETDGGGWTVFQRRLNGKTDFYRGWSDYTNGFGNLSDEFWLGNELLHNLTSMGPVSLRVDMREGNDTAYAHYANFTIESEARHYAIEVAGFTGTAGDSMKYHNGRPFSTKDKDPNPLGIHCARAYMGGWWYKNCYKTNLNGLYGVRTNNQGVVWIDWKGKDASIAFTEMKFRPAGFSPATHG